MDKTNLLKLINDDIDLPIEAYDTAVNRYKNLAEHFNKNEQLGDMSPIIRSQGSFRLGTAIKPIENDQDYDLDITCILSNGFDTNVSTQADLVSDVEKCLEDYRTANNIKKPIKAKRRCLCLEYSSENFHIDVVPSIPAPNEYKDTLSNRLITERMIDETLAKNISKYAVLITDNKDVKKHNKIHNDWPRSNPEGYAKWFENQIKTKDLLLEERMSKSFLNSVDKIPAYKWNSPLQKVIKVFKRHRDIMYMSSNDEEKDLKPTSIIITTLVAQLYNGETDIEKLIDELPSKMVSTLHENNFIINNPTRLDEEFTDKWAEKPELKEHFVNWLNRLSETSSLLTKETDSQALKLIMESRFGIDSGSLDALSKKVIAPTIVVESTLNPPKPWLR